MKQINISTQPTGQFRQNCVMADSYKKDLNLSLHEVPIYAYPPINNQDYFYQTLKHFFWNNLVWYSRTFLLPCMSMEEIAPLFLDLNGTNKYLCSLTIENISSQLPGIRVRNLSNFSHALFIAEEKNKRLWNG